MIFQSAYQTTACKHFNMGQIRDGIYDGVRNHQVDFCFPIIANMQNEVVPHHYPIKALMDKATGMPFGHPVVVDFSDPFWKEAKAFFDKNLVTSDSSSARDFGNQSQDVVVVIDSRPFLKFTSNGDQSFTSKPEYQLLLTRGLMNDAWVSLPINRLKNLGELPVSTYANWISQNIARRFSLDAGAQLDIYIMSGIFYETLFMDGAVEIDVNKQSSLIASVTTNLKTQSKLVLEVMEKMESKNIVLSDMVSFCQAIRDVTENVRLKDLNHGLLVSLLKGTWYSANAAEILAIAIEHPPTWLSLIYTALTEKMYRKSGISAIVERFPRKVQENTLRILTQHVKELA